MSAPPSWGRSSSTKDDLALATYVCPGKYDYGPLLRAALERLRKEHG